MKTKNRHGRVGVKTPLATTQRREAYHRGKKAGIDLTETFYLSKIANATNLRSLKKEVGIS